MDLECTVSDDAAKSETLHSERANLPSRI